MKSLQFLILLPLLTSCSSSTNPSLIGSWITEACEQAPEEAGTDEGKWGKGIYEFTEDNTIIYTIQFYFGSTCTVPTTNIVPYNNDNFLSYIDSGPVTLQEGIEGNKFTLIFTTATPPANIDGFYSISNGKLCFSDGFSFNPFSIRTNGSVTTTNNINFERCLAKL